MKSRFHSLPSLFTCKALNFFRLKGRLPLHELLLEILGFNLNLRSGQFFRDVVVPVFTLSANTNTEEGGKIYFIERICEYLIL